VSLAARSFDTFYEQHYPRVLGSLRLVARTWAEAEDAAQDAFAKAFVKWSSVSKTSRPGTWVYVVALRDLRRRERRQASGTARREPVSSDARDHAAAVAGATTLEGALLGLAPRQRVAVVLRFHADLSVREISQVMRCSEGTVKSTLHAALQRLRVDLTDDDQEGLRHGH
jgi:RNA polymerase sigma-70 factor (ECF subfamily)